MAETNESPTEKFGDEWRHLHKYSAEQIQQAFANALKELTGQKYGVEVRAMDRHPADAHMAGLYDIVDMKLRVTFDTGPSPF